MVVWWQISFEIDFEYSNINYTLRPVMMIWHCLSLIDLFPIDNLWLANTEPEIETLTFWPAVIGHIYNSSEEINWLAALKAGYPV